VDPNGFAVGECRFEYGPTSTYGSSAPCEQAPGSRESPVAVLAAIGGLLANTTYHFRIVATNAGGTSEGADETFKTLPNPPAAVTNAVLLVDQTSAAVTASLNPEGALVSECRFEYGTTMSYGSSVPCIPPPGSGTSPVAVGEALTSLSPNTTYHFRIVATNAGGTSYGVDHVFSTLANTSIGLPFAGGPFGSGLTGIVGAGGISSAQIKALLADQLIPSGKAAKIRALLKSGGFSLVFNALEAGVVVIDWYQVPSGANLARKAHPGPLLIAVGKLTFSAKGTARMKIKLTVAGRRLLKHAKQLKVTAKGTFTPRGKSPITTTRVLLLKQ
jgi:hypothetical protein